MEWGINSIMDFLEVLSFLATIIGGIAILFAVRDYSISRKQLHLSALESCITRYRDEFLGLNMDSPELMVVKYIDLVNEELFYFEHQYLPMEVAAEWIDGMIDYLPLFDPTGNVLNKGSCLPMIAQRKILDQYRFRRVKRAFTIRIPVEMEWVYGDPSHPVKEDERKKVIYAIIDNLKSVAG